jgi:O-methyltransferase involved in polyketide biosynthesis
VTMYLTPEAIRATFGFIASTPPGGGVAFDYAIPRGSLNWMGRLALDALMRRVAAAGEPFRTFFEPAELMDELRGMGFRDVEDLDSEAIHARYFANRMDGLRVGGNLAHLMSAEI